MKIRRRAILDGYIDFDDTLIRILEPYSEESDGGPMSFEVGEIEIADVDENGTAIINWGCGQVAYLYGDQFEVLSDLEKIALLVWVKSTSDRDAPK
jgi:hypothetical protein